MKIPKWFLIVALLFTISTVALAEYFYTVYIRTSLVFQPGATLTGNAVLRGSDAFTTTVLLDTIRVVGVTANDVVLAIAKRNSSPVAGDVLSAFAGANGDTIFVSRAANTTSGLPYYWFRLK